MRLRLTAYSLAGLQGPMHTPHGRHPGLGHAKNVLVQATSELVAFYERVAVLVGRPVAREVMLPVSGPAFTGLNGTTAPTGASSEDVGVVTEVGAALEAAGPDGANRAERAERAERAGSADRADRAGGLGADDVADLVRIIATRHHPHLLWVQEHLQHLSSHAQAITTPATHVAEQRRQPWWR